MKRIKLIIGILLFLQAANAQSKLLDASTIPAELKKNAYSVKREERIEFEVKSVSKAVYKVHQLITVLDERGKDELEFHEFSDQFHSLESVSIQVFDSKGETIQKIKRSDLIKQMVGEGLVGDSKVYFTRFPTSSYPTTMQVDYEVSFSGLLNYPDYDVQVPEQSVENSVFVVKVPIELDLRFKAKNTTLSPTTTDDGKVKTYTWTSKNLTAVEYEPGSVSRESRYPHIMLSPTRFGMDDYPGDMSSWQSFGYWYGSLAKKANNLTEERKQFFRTLVKDAPSEREKVRSIYSYLQANCRYVLITLGIGGYQPFEADFVDKKKYGDCKALSNYTQACLSAVGIKSYQALINASYDKEPVDPAFPHNGFNHVIVCVPMQKDSIWLECTSNTTEFGVLGNFTENRNALLITEDGGKLVPTPKSKASDNVFSSHSLVDLGADGAGTVNVTLHTTGEFKQEMMGYVGGRKKDDQKRFLVYYMGYILPDEFEINYNDQDKKAPATMMMSIGKIPEFTAGRKLFLNPRLYKIWDRALPKSEGRTQDFYFEHPLIKIDTTIYKLPEGFAIETLPKPKKILFEYGSFIASYQFDENKKEVISVAKLELNQYKIPPDHFAATKDFFNTVLGEYTEKIVVKKL
jgi:hypothetical protein